MNFIILASLILFAPSLTRANQFWFHWEEVQPKNMNFHSTLIVYLIELSDDGKASINILTADIKNRDTSFNSKNENALTADGVWRVSKNEISIIGKAINKSSGLEEDPFEIELISTGKRIRTVSSTITAIGNRRLLFENITKARFESLRGRWGYRWAY